MKVLVVGAGPIGVEYSAVLDYLGIRHDMCRKSEITSSLANTKILGGGVEKIPSKLLSTYTHIIVATDISQTLPVLENLAPRFNGFILAEKPISLSSCSLNQFVAEHPDKAANIYVGLNRRYFLSVQTLLKELKETKHNISFRALVGESPARIPTSKGGSLHEFWPIANSCHIFDLLTFIFGELEVISADISGACIDNTFTLNAHLKSRLGNKGTIYGDFSGKVGWGIEIFVGPRRFLLEPLEQLIELHGEFGRQPQTICSTPQAFKVGFLEMTKDFLYHDEITALKLPTITSWTKQIEFIEQLYNLSHLQDLKS